MNMLTRREVIATAALAVHIDYMNSKRNYDTE
jgi:hypothetical protein